ncbi:hypothetical protein Sjap_004264 [Stephania japonica]|uniref:3-hydroxyisobutyryl-CoA hydrolase n=1 Tax=Stephania japonica TaxID=461633 RepID=A0AAP0K1Z6_9MAGN
MILLLWKVVSRNVVILFIQMKEVHCVVLQTPEREASISSDEWSTATVKRLKEASPLALKLALKSIREGRYQTLDQCLIREYRMTLRSITKQVSGDFSEGVRARLVAKDLNPKWNPPRLDLVSEDMVESYFAPFGGSEPELELPTKLREAFI